ncbi:hypothetical protein SAMD00019534_029380 [Acytostelium subglobosum LB1]|uniref:hypothetical protein n=1 Tax=Acytostelium subglobosum LB1 TaxID=1410327 RepID=UPI000644F7AE|nr:hypothetical protein SAMD00019534_029380 [Acytostelium subglobosum LB1]GAM19763.1 hypothetical protein SAMD00019534_029380 [Acytostelium subglobosum LB1]|eukprot:XP_012756525.1 hypothetical protein SAMD00019534_029380 [Acytostelium subglobosum LB1]
MDNNNNKRKGEDIPVGGAAEKKVRFTEQPEVRVFHNDNSNDNGKDNGNGKDIGNDNKKEDVEMTSVSSRPSLYIDDDDIMQQIARADEKYKKRMEDTKRRESYFDRSEMRDAVEEVGEDGIIKRVEGEEEEEPDDYDHPSNNNKSRNNNTKQRVREEDDDDDDDDEVEIMPFNLRQERDEGHYKQDGTYEQASGEKEDDPWLQEYDEVWRNKVPKLSRKELLKQEAEDQTDENEDLWEKEEEEEKQRRRKGPTVEERDNRRMCLTKLVGILEDGETSLAALRRLGGNNKPVIKKKLNKHQLLKQQQQQQQETTTKPAEDSDMEEKRKQQFLQLTEATDYLLANGFMNIYTESKEVVQQLLYKDIGRKPPAQVRSSNANNNNNGNNQSTTTATTDQQQQARAQLENDDNDEDNILWEYKLTDGNVYQNFTGLAMRQWKDGGFFTDKGVVARKIGDYSFVPVEQLNF